METAWVRRVLVVEDQPAMRVLLCDMLAHRGFEVTGAADAAEATTLFAGTDPDVLLTDIDLGSRPSAAELATIRASRSSSSAASRERSPAPGAPARRAPCSCPSST